jgi:adenylate kinase
MIVLVTGIDDSGRDDVIETVLKSYKNIMPANTLIKASDFIPDISAERSISRLEKIRDNGLAALEKTFVAALKKGGNIVVSSGITRSVPQGYMPVLTKDMADTIKPDLMIFMEVVPQNVQAYMQHEHVDWSHQRFERQLAGLFSLQTGSVMKVVKIKSGQVKEALKETADALRAAME